jgi:hypothetical protein
MTNDGDRPEVAVCGFDGESNLVSRVEKESRIVLLQSCFSPVEGGFCQCNRLLVSRSVCLLANMCVHECVTERASVCVCVRASLSIFVSVSHFNTNKQ